MCAYSHAPAEWREIFAEAQVPYAKIMGCAQFMLITLNYIKETMYYWGVNSKMQTSHTLCSRPKRYGALQVMGPRVWTVLNINTEEVDNYLVDRSKNGR